MSRPELPDTLEPVTMLARHSDVVGARIAGLHGEVDAAFSHLAECVIVASVDRLDLGGATIVDTRAETFTATEVIARDARWRTVEVSGGRIGTLDLLRAELDVVTFCDVRIDYLSLSGARLRDVQFERCRIGTLDVPQAAFERVSFEDCQVDEVDTRDLRARDVDLRGLEALSFTDPAGLRGTTLDDRQAQLHAAAFATALGISVTE